MTCPSKSFSFHPLTSITNHFYFQAMVMMKGLIGWCLNHETTLDCIRKRANKTEDELSGLKAWKVGMDKKFATSKTVKKELKQKVESLEKAQVDKEKEIKDAKDQLCQAKEAAVREYRDSDALLAGARDLLCGRL